MQPKISKTLEGIIARSAFNTTKAGITHSLKDFLALELLREEGSLAFQLLSARLRDWERLPPAWVARIPSWCTIWPDSA